jgi:hypothetical protein
VKRLAALVIVLLAVACGETPTYETPPVVSPTPSPPVAKSTARPNVQLWLYSKGGYSKEWKIPQAVAEWNRNGVNRFKVVPYKNCERQDVYRYAEVEDLLAYCVNIEEVNTANFEGEDVYGWSQVITYIPSIRLNRRHLDDNPGVTACHELGHVLLGQGHPKINKPASCMFDGSFNNYSKPSQQDLENAGKNLWTPDVMY